MFIIEAMENNSSVLYGPFAEITPNGQTGWLHYHHDSASDYFRHVLGLIDGDGRYTYCMWRGSNPESIVVRRDDIGETFLQAAGSADAMTIEVRLLDTNNNGKLYTIGRQESASDAKQLIPMSDERAIEVFSNEVFTSDEAATIFNHYYLTETIPETYTLRELDLSQELSEER